MYLWVDDMWKHDPHNFCPNCGVKMEQEVR